MAERYSRVFSLPSERYVPGCPVVLAAGALLKDNVTGGVLAQLKFRNISAKAIVGMKVRVAPFDLAGKKLKDVEFDYLDMTVSYGAEFGQKTAIFLPDASARKYEVTVTQVVFAKGTVLEQAFADWQPLPQKLPLTAWLKDEELCRQYRILHGRECAYRPQQRDGIRTCACGSENMADSPKCAKCGKNIDTLLATDLDALKADMKARLEKERLEAEAEAKRLKEKTAAARKKALITGTAIVVSVLTAAILYFKVISPAITYSNAEKLEAEGNYGKAMIAYRAVGNYRDAISREAALWGKISELSSYLSAGDDHTVGVRADGMVVAVGWNRYEQCDLSSWRDIVAVSAGYSHTVGLKADGTVVAAGSNWRGQCDVSGWQDIVAVSAGYNRTVGLKADGTVVAVGESEDNQCDVLGWQNIIAVSAGYSHTVGLKADGTVVAAGSNWRGQCDVSDWQNIIAISAGNFHTLGLKADGTVVAVGSNDAGQCGVTDWQNIIGISAGQKHTVGLKADGTVIVVGDESVHHNASDWQNIVAISAGDFHTVGLKADGTVVAVGAINDGQCAVSDWTDIGPAK